MKTHLFQGPPKIRILKKMVLAGYFFLFLFLFGGGGMYTLQCACGSQKTTGKRRIFPSTLWVSGMVSLRCQSCLVAGTFTPSTFTCSCLCEVLFKQTFLIPQDNPPNALITGNNRFRRLKLKTTQLRQPAGVKLKSV